MATDTWWASTILTVVPLTADHHPMRILHVTHELPPYELAGTAIYSLNIARAQSQHHDVFIFARLQDPEIEAYRQVLESYSRRLLPHVDWRPTDRGNVEVLNDTGDFYRFFDATPHAEFLFACVAQTIDTDLPAETRFLRAYDGFKSSVSGLIDMPDRTLDLLFRFLHQNGGRLSGRARTREFAALTDEEADRTEAIYAELQEEF